MLSVSLNRHLKSKPENPYMVTYRGSPFRHCTQFSGFLFGRNDMGKFERWDKKELSPIFYVYLIIDKELNIPVYVGKGHNNRVLSSNEEYSRIIGKETIYKFVFAGLNEERAFKFEKDLIFVIGRKDKEEGPLLNKTDGGGPISGIVFTKELCMKISNSNKGKKKNHSKKHRKNLAIRLSKFNQEHWKGKSRPKSENIKKKMSASWKARKYRILEQEQKEIERKREHKKKIYQKWVTGRGGEGVC